jgi:hypothetical protein
MPFIPGPTRYELKKWLEDRAALPLKLALYSNTTALDANADPALAYGVAGELTATGTGYTPGGYTLADKVVTASGNGYALTFGAISLGDGSVSVGTYGAMVYNPDDSNRALWVFQINIYLGSSNSALTVSIPADAVTVGV